MIFDCVGCVWNSRGVTYVGYGHVDGVTCLCERFEVLHRCDVLIMLQKCEMLMMLSVCEKFWLCCSYMCDVLMLIVLHTCVRWCKHVCDMLIVKHVWHADGITCVMCWYCYIYMAFWWCYTACIECWQRRYILIVMLTLFKYVWPAHGFICYVWRLYDIIFIMMMMMMIMMMMMNDN